MVLDKNNLFVIKTENLEERPIFKSICNKLLLIIKTSFVLVIVSRKPNESFL